MGQWMLNLTSLELAFLFWFCFLSSGADLWEMFGQIRITAWHHLAEHWFAPPKGTWGGNLWMTLTPGGLKGFVPFDIFIWRMKGPNLLTYTSTSHSHLCFVTLDCELTFCKALSVDLYSGLTWACPHPEQVCISLSGVLSWSGLGVGRAFFMLISGLVDEDHSVSIKNHKST